MSSRPADAARSALYDAKQKALAQRMSLPSLHLLIWPTASAVRLSLVVYYSVPGMRRTCKVLRQVEWNPREVTERALLEWGHRAIAGYLAEIAEAELKQQES